FGFGLSYTTFELSNLSAAPPGGDGVASVALDVKNTGAREGAEVVQVYVAAPVAAGEPPKQLKGFAKVSLKAGETKHVTITLDPRAFSIWDTDKNRWTVVPGRHEVLAGSSSRDLPLHGEVTIAQ